MSSITTSGAQLHGPDRTLPTKVTATPGGPSLVSNEHTPGRDRVIKDVGAALAPHRRRGGSGARHSPLWRAPVPLGPANTWRLCRRKTCGLLPTAGGLRPRS